MLRLEGGITILLIALLGACADAEGDEELQEGDSPAMEEVAPAPDLTGWDEDGNGALADAEWTAYVTDHMAMHVWDANASSMLEQVEFESGAVAGRAPDATFESWDADESGGVDESEWTAAWRARYDTNEDGGVSAEELASAP